jgi:hypothetical protein
MTVDIRNRETGRNRNNRRQIYFQAVSIDVNISLSPPNSMLLIS